MSLARWLLLLAVSAGIAFGSPTAAGAHGFGAMSGYVSTVSGVDPLVLGVNAFVLQGDDRLRLSNLSRKTVVILGYDGEPYLRFTPRSVFENVRSPAAYRNRDRWGVVAVPAFARPGAKPKWRRVSPTPTWTWHDHRIQWMRPNARPAAIRAAPRRQHKIFDWRVPARADGKPFVITGFLGYAPPPVAASKGSDIGRMAMWAAAGGAAIAAAAAAFLFMRRRPQPVAPHPGGEAGSTRHPPGA